MKKGLIKAGFYSGIFKVWLWAWGSRSFHILMYHHVTDRDEVFLPQVTARVFGEQMEYLKREYRVRGLDELVEMIKRGEEIPARSVAITFDDGYEDIYRNAFPVLKKYDLPATVFVSTGFIDDDRLPWTDELGFIFKETIATGLEIMIGGRSECFSFRDEADRLGVFREVKNRLKLLYDPERAELCEQIKKQLVVSQSNPVRILTGSQIKEMAEEGISFGTHTVHHPILTRIPPRRAQEEITESKSCLEDIIGQEVKGFCYPNGGKDDFNDVIKSMVQHAGYWFGCTTVEGANGPDADPYALKRNWTSEPSLPLFAARLLRR